VKLEIDNRKQRPITAMKIRITKNVFLISLLLGTLLSLSACGFHLKGSEALPAAPYSLDGLKIRGKALPPGTREQLILATKSIRQKPDQKKEKEAASIIVSDYYSERRRIGQASLTAFDQYLIIKQAEYGLALPETSSNTNPPLLGPISSRVETVFIDNSNQALSKSNEEKMIHQELERLLAKDILRQLNTVLSTADETRSDKSP
jgi:outer membrane lipopolysaccharide assembly protein LptE/RlpB